MSWLSNFPDQDRDTARLLLDSVRIASSDEIRSGIQSLLGEQRFRLPAVLIPVRSMEDLQLKAPSEGGRPRDSAVAYEDFLPGSPLAVTPGSEGFIGTLIRDLTGSSVSRRGRGWLHPLASLDELEQFRCRTLIFVSDYAGSGDQMTRYIASFLRNPRIRSWRSFGWIRVAAVTFAQSRSAGVALSALAHDVHSCEPARSISTAGWDWATQTRVEALCRKYAGSKQVRQALGYGASGGLFVSSVSSIPNNLPWILRRRGANWKAFFEGRSFPPDLLEQVGSYQPPAELPAVVQAVGQIRLANSLQSGRHGEATVTVLTILALLYDRAGQSQVDLAHTTGLTFQKVDEVLTFLRRGNLVDDEHRVTTRGVEELRASRRLRRGVPDSLPVEPVTPYYPRQLR
ncbi:phosphoribosyltransferase-like protein [Cellulomonas sp. McL0617]|uniref:phosphoribosyltransferase-like protein n=1 Tax=Cellulomonas sp. McL0617 TaxID=3415675 RepID=UPI003CE86DC0